MKTTIGLNGKLWTKLYAEAIPAKSAIRSSISAEPFLEKRSQTSFPTPRNAENRKPPVSPRIKLERPKAV